MWSLEELVKEFTARNVTVVFRHLHFWDGILIEIKGRWLCYVNSRNSARQQRWTLAHELGHLDLHQRQGSLFTDGIFHAAEEDTEWQANRYASEILMPPPSVSVVIGASLSHREKIRGVFQEFGVPEKAAAWWLLELGYISKKSYSSYRHELQSEDDQHLELKL